MKKLVALTLALALFGVLPLTSFAQTQQEQQPSTEELEKLKAEREKNAYRLLDQVIDEAQSLRLVENRVKVQINAADMLWSQDQGRARSLFSMAADGVAELGRTPANAPNRRVTNFVDGSGSFNTPTNIRAFQWRQELVMAAARHDAALAYQLLAATKPPATLNSAEQRGPRAQLTSEENLEQALLGRIASLDPKFAAQNAEQMLEKGQFPRSLPEVINQLRRQDSEAAEKLTDKTLKRIQSADILSNNEAALLVQAFLAPGPLPATQSTNTASPAVRTGRAPVLEQSAYIDLLSSVIDAALKATNTTQSNQRGTQRRAQVTAGATRTTIGPPIPTEAQIEQSNARRLLAGLQANLPLIEQHLPGKAHSVKQKMSELMMINNPTQNLAQTFASLQGGNNTADALLQAAAAAPPQVQSRLYQEAAFRALEDGDTERARQIALDHLQNNARDAVIRRIDFRELSKKAEGARLEEIRQTVARLQSDNEKITLLVQLATDTEKANPKLALQLLEDARQMTNRRATSYEHFDQQLRVAHAFINLDPARSFEILDPGIGQLNELLAAAAVLSGFEVNMFREGEMAIQGGNGLTSTITRYGNELALLARSDFDRSETLAGRFQFVEARILTRLSIVQGLLDIRPQGNVRR
jgi:hypothetical protein